MLLIVRNIPYQGSYLVSLDAMSSEYVSEKLAEEQPSEADPEVMELVFANETKVLEYFGTEVRGLTLFNPLTDPALPIDEVFSVVDDSTLPADAYGLSSYYDHTTSTFITHQIAVDESVEEGVQEYMDSLVIGIGESYDAGMQVELPQEIIDAISPSKLVEVKLSQMERRFEHTLNWITWKYSRDEISSWPEQKRDVDIWEALAPVDKTVGNAPSGLKELAKQKHGIANDVDLDPTTHIQERADDISVNATFYLPYALGAVGKKKKLRDTLAALPTDVTAKTPEEVTAMRTAINAVDSKGILSFGIQKFIDAGLLQP